MVGLVVQWYNEEHRHSAINFVTPTQRHAGLDTALLEKCAIVYEAAKNRCPECWSGTTQNWQPVLVVRLNRDQYIAEKDEKMEAVLELKMAA
jgi:putative transposase